MTHEHNIVVTVNRAVDTYHTVTIQEYKNVKQMPRDGVWTRGSRSRRKMVWMNARNSDQEVSDMTATMTINGIFSGSFALAYGFVF